MADPKKANNSLSKGNSSVATKEKESNNVLDLIKKGESQFAMALPRHLKSDRFVRIAITEVRKNPKLLNCKPESLIGALLTSASLGLEPGILGQAYLIPYGSEVNFQISYKGQIELARRSGSLSDIYAYVVHENDEFSLTYGLERDLKHTPNFKDPGKVTGVYAVAKMKDGAIAFEYMTYQEIEVHKKKFSKTHSNGPWVTDWEAMAKKTVVKQLMKWLPVSTDFLESMQRENGINKVDINKLDSKEQIEVNFEEMKVVESEIEKASKEEIQDLLDNASMVGIDIKKIAKDNGMDFINLSSDDIATLQSIVDDEINKKMGE